MSDLIVRLSTNWEFDYLGIDTSRRFWLRFPGFVIVSSYIRARARTKSVTPHEKNSPAPQNCHISGRSWETARSSRGPSRLSRRFSDVSVQLPSNSRRWLRRTFACKQHQMRHLCDL